MCVHEEQSAVKFWTQLEMETGVGARKVPLFHLEKLEVICGIWGHPDHVNNILWRNKAALIFELKRTLGHAVPKQLPEKTHHIRTELSSQVTYSQTYFKDKGSIYIFIFSISWLFHLL